VVSYWAAVSTTIGIGMYMKIVAGKRLRCDFSLDAQSSNLQSADVIHDIRDLFGGAC